MVQLQSLSSGSVDSQPMQHRTYLFSSLHNVTCYSLHTEVLGWSSLLCPPSSQLCTSVFSRDLILKVKLVRRWGKSQFSGGRFPRPPKGPVWLVNVPATLVSTPTSPAHPQLDRPTVDNTHAIARQARRGATPYFSMIVSDEQSWLYHGLSSSLV